MADITMCEDVKCPQRDKCYRFTAPVTELRQSYFLTSPRVAESDDCNQFWDNTGRQRETRTKYIQK